MSGISALFQAVRERCQHPRLDAGQSESRSSDSTQVMAPAKNNAVGVRSELRIDRMMEVFRVDRRELEQDYAKVLLDAQITCLRCRSKRRCFRELEAGTAVANAEQFCPNADILLVFANDPAEAATARPRQPSR